MAAAPPYRRPSPRPPSLGPPSVPSPSRGRGGRLDPPDAGACSIGLRAAVCVPQPPCLPLDWRTTPLGPRQPPDGESRYEGHKADRRDGEERDSCGLIAQTPSRAPSRCRCPALIDAEVLPRVVGTAFAAVVDADEVAARRRGRHPKLDGTLQGEVGVLVRRAKDHRRHDARTMRFPQRSRAYGEVGSVRVEHHLVRACSR